MHHGRHIIDQVEFCRADRILIYTRKLRKQLHFYLEHFLSFYTLSASMLFESVDSSNVLLVDVLAYCNISTTCVESTLSVTLLEF